MELACQRTPVSRLLLLQLLHTAEEAARLHHRSAHARKQQAMPVDELRTLALPMICAKLEPKI